ncbi:DNA-binding protein kinase TEL1 ASCRUDRAFT_31068 [Ascoidea rubescens DSM 1968]|uniref:Serine/threonine-protein kinase TEL1 n=1 Tax=Ascoidea rubescens DSM 1968 TaxID=1344418 RepID=A0A1D2VPR9_9ASCO|nr:hypothetical protein ASCRUDRAFT_31068 [Ascoidea rubescens DSM 1968]ODV63547.1 hypothetical protein ASCRUDRAFT_31068 [Ascoidea rubescens DSM 1968]
MEQVFEKCNRFFQADKETRKRKLKLRTYKVVPIGNSGGIIEFVCNTISFIDIVYPYHLKHDEMSYSDAKGIMLKAQNKTKEIRISEYKRICDKIQPVFRYYFMDKYLDSNSWFESKISYCCGTASSSIVGHVLGLGDRHCNNILINEFGEPIHIDLGVAFDQGKLLPIPETVPFRLTRDIVDGFGISGEGMFKKNSECCFKVLRNNKAKISTMLEVLKWDPLYSFVVTPLKKLKLQKLSDITIRQEIIKEDDNDKFSGTEKALGAVQQKLVADGLSNEAVVSELIQEATDVNNLAVIYVGWSPFY